MFAFLRTAAARWVLMVVTIPLAAWALREIADLIDRRSGYPRTISRVLRKAGSWLPSRGNPAVAVPGPQAARVGATPSR